MFPKTHYSGSLNPIPLSWQERAQVGRKDGECGSCGTWTGKRSSGGGGSRTWADSRWSGSQTEPEGEVLEQDTGWGQCPCVGLTVLFTGDSSRGRGTVDTAPREAHPLSLRVRNASVVLPMVSSLRAFLCGDGRTTHIEPSLHPSSQA